MKISACIITKNEELNIENCLNSYKEAVDEIILVDTGSEDNTVALAEKVGAQVFFFQWNNSFKDAKNFALEKASGDWVIFLDADEYFSEECRGSLRGLIEKIDKENRYYDAILCRMIDIDKDRNMQIGQGSLIRIFRRNREIRYQGSIHEMLFKDGDNLKNIYIAGEKELLIWHTGYTSSLLPSKTNRNLKLLLQLLNKYETIESNTNHIQGEIRKELIYFYLTEAYLTLGEYEKVIKYADMFMNTGVPVFGFNSLPYRAKIIAMMNSKQKSEDVTSVINASIAKFPLHPEFIQFRAEISNEGRSYLDALKDFLLAIDLNKNYKDFESNLMPLALYDTYFKIGLLYKYVNYLSEAEIWLYRALETRKKEEACLSSWLKCNFKADTRVVIDKLNRIYKNDDEQDVYVVLNAASKLKMGKIISYYLNIWNKKFGHEDMTIVHNYYSNHYFNEAFPYYSEAYKIKEEYGFAILTLICALLTKHKEKINWVRNNIQDPVIRKLLYCLSTGEIVKIEDEEEDKLKIAIIEFAYIGAVDYVKILIRNYMYSIFNTKYEIFDVLFDSGYETAVCEVVEEILYQFQEADGILLFKLAHAYFRLSESGECLRCLRGTVRAGYCDNHVIDLIQWVIESKTYKKNPAEKDIVDEAEALLRECDEKRRGFSLEDPLIFENNIKRLNKDKLLGKRKDENNILKEREMSAEEEISFLKGKLIKNISDLIGKGEIEIAKSLIHEYRSIWKEDEEISSIERTIIQNEGK